MFATGPGKCDERTWEKTRLFLVVVNQPKIQQQLELGNQSFDNTLSTAS
jgi:hypothetical protein